MDKIEKEIRDLLKTNINTVHTAEAGTTATNITITNHGLSTGEFIQNVTRSAVLEITVVDANNFTVVSTTGQTVGDSITFLRFKKYYVGQVDAFPLEYLPCLCLYGKSTDMRALSSNTDMWAMSIVIEAYIDAFSKVSLSDVSDNDDILRAQQTLKQLMEQRDANGIALPNTVLGVLRRNILGSNYLYSNAISIQYSKHVIKNKVYFKAIMELKAVTKFSLRK